MTEFAAVNSVLTPTVTALVEENTAPTGLALSANEIAENSANGTVIGELSATDADDDELTYTLEDDAGGKFALVREGGMTKLVVNGALDYETATSHDVTVKVSDGNGGETTQTFTVNVSDLPAIGSRSVVASGNSASESTVTALANGDYVVAWRATVDGDNGVRGRIFAANGTPVGGEFAIESTTQGTQQSANIVALPEGGFLALWSSNDAQGADASGSAIRARLFAADGAPLGNDFVVNTSYNSNQSQPVGTVLSDGRILVTWTSSDVAGSDNSSAAIRAIVLNADGSIPGGAQDVVINTIIQGAQQRPVVTALADGGYVIAWQSADTTGPDTSSTKIRMTQFNAAGAVVGAADYQANTTPDGGQQLPKIAALPNGGYVIVWPSADTGDGSGNTIRARIFDASGAPAGNDFIVNSTSAGNQATPSVTILGDGRIFIAWTSPETTSVVRGRVFASDGTPAGNDFVVGFAQSGSVSNPTVALLDGGSVVVTWGEGGAVVRNVLDLYSVGFENSAPNNLSLSGSAVAEQSENGTVVGTLSATDVDSQLLTYTLIDDAGGKFALRNDAGVTKLVVNGPISYAEAASLDVTVKVSDGNGGEVTQTYTIAVIDIVDVSVADTSSFPLQLDANAFTVLDQSVTVLPDGKILVVYRGVVQAISSNINLYAEVFDAEGNSLVGAFRLDDGTVANPGNIAVAALAGGNVAVSWNGSGAAGQDVQVRIVSTGGTAVSDVIPAHSLTADAQERPAVLALDSGGFLVAYRTGSVVEGDGSGGAVMAQRFDAAGNKVGGESVLNSTTDGDQGFPRLVAIDGGFAAIYTSPNSESNAALRIRLFNDDGTPRGADSFVTDGGIDTSYPPKVAVLADGGFAVAWTIRDSGSGSDIRARLYDAGGNPVASEFSVSSTGDLRDDELSTITALADGGFVVTWNSQNGTYDQLYARVYGADGTPAEEILLIAGVAGDFYPDAKEVSVVDLGGGNVLFSWFYQGNSQSVTATLYESDENSAPSDLALSTDDVAENSAIGTVIGTLSATDADDDELTYTIQNDPDGKFALVTEEGVTRLVVNGALDYETATSHEVTVKVSDGNGGEATRTFIVNVMDVDEGPAPIVIIDGNFKLTFDDLTWGENIQAGTVLGIVTLANPGGLNYIEFYGYNVQSWDLTDKIDFVSDSIAWASGTDLNGETTLTMQMVAKVDLDFSSLDTLNLYFSVFAADWEEEATLDFDVGIDQAPENVGLSQNDVAEDAAVGTVVGILSATDAEGDVLTFALEDDAGGKFSLVTEEGVTKLVVDGALDYETATSHDVTVKVSDGENEVAQIFTVNVTDVAEVNLPPTGIALSNTTVSEGERAGAVVGVLSAIDPEGDAITWSLVAGQGDNNDYFDLRTNDDGSVSVVLKTPLNFEGNAAVNAVYDLVVKATDSHGNETTQTIAVQSTDEAVMLTAAPTGMNYAGVMENVAVGQEIGFFVDFDDRATPLAATLLDDAGGLFAITTRDVGGVTRWYLTVNGPLDHETANIHFVTIRATGVGGVTQDKTYEIHVLDAAEEGDTARGTITIDASTLLAASNGGVNWDTYLDTQYAKVLTQLPSGVAFAPGTSSEYVYSLAGDSALSLKGQDLAYWWSDPESGKDVHVVGGTVQSLTFGAGANYVLTDPELTISGLDLSNGSALLDRIYGEANNAAVTWMYGPDSNHPADIEFLKASIASYAQHFIGSEGDDTYTGTLFNDTITGNGGMDTLSGGGGDDLIDGGEDDDTAVFTGNRADYTVTDNGDGTWTVTDNRLVNEADGTDTLAGIEFAQFADQILALESEPENHAPANLALSANTVAENSANGTVIGELSASDADGDTLTYTIENDSDGRFALVTEEDVTKLVVNGALDFETATSHEVVVKVSDGNGGETTETFTVSVTDVDEGEPPTGPEVSVSGNGVGIADGDTTPDAIDGTTFGTHMIGAVVERTFAVTNDGTADLSTKGLKLPKGFKLAKNDKLPSKIAAGQSATFTVVLDTKKVGAFGGAVTFKTNDPNEGTFDFAISATVQDPDTVPPQDRVGDATDNTFLATADVEAFYGLEGADTVSYSGAGAVVASLASSSKNAGYAAGDVYDSIENLAGSAFSDRLTGDGGDNVLEGGAGADTLDGGNGNDTASYASASETITVDLLNSKNNVGEDAAGDTYKNVENVLGSAFGDRLVGNKVANGLDGGAGDDTLVGNAGLDTLTGGPGTDTFQFASTKDSGGTTGDLIVDFVSGEDYVGILRSGFKINAGVDIGAAGTLDFAQHYFVSAMGEAPTASNPSGVAATESGHGQFLFNQATDQLWWDADGTGNKAAVLLATFQNGAHVLASDFDML